MQELYEKSDHTENIHLFLDNFFTSMALVETLTAKEFHATGTVRENCSPGNPLENRKIFKKKLSHNVKHYSRKEKQNVQVSSGNN